MRSYATFFIIAVMSLGLVFLLLTKDRPARLACGGDAGMTDCVPAEEIVPEAADVGADGAAKPDGEAVAVTTEAGASKPAGAPMRVTTLGWDLVAAGAALVPPDGTPTTPPMELAPEAALEAVEARLARGGADPQGADIAVLPLPAFVTAFERIRALEPRAFLVVGFSRGREEVRSTPGALLKAPPAGDEVKMVGYGPATSTDAAARAAGSESATVLGIFAMDLLGVGTSRLRLVAPGPDAKAAPFAALVRGAADERKVAFSTADASRLIPIVAIAPKGVIDAKENLLRDWSKAWLDGLVKAAKDTPAIARRIAAKDSLPFATGVGGAPEAIHLVERLGQIEAAGLDKQRVWIGPEAKGTITLDVLTQKTWQLARAGGFTTSAAPEALPIDPRVVMQIAPAAPAPAPPPADDPDGGAYGPGPAGATPLLAYRSAEGDTATVASQMLFLSGVFERAIFRVSAKGGDKAAKAIAAAAREKGIPANRLATAAAEPQGVAVSVELLSPP